MPTKPPTTTNDKLRVLMQSHVQNTSIEKPKVEPIMSAEPKSPVVPKQASPVSPVASTVAFQPSKMRYSLKLLPAELSKINGIIGATLQITGERITMTDVMRVAIGRLGESAPLFAQEIAALRKTDARRHHSLSSPSNLK